MEEPSVIHDTFVIERSYPRPPAAVFAVFADPAQKRRWFAEAEHAADFFEMDFRVGGAERLRWLLGDDTPFPGTPITTEGRHEDIVPDRRIVISSTMSLGDRRISTALVTVELLATAKGTDLICTHQAAFYEGADGPEMRKTGWEKLFDSLGAELARQSAAA